MLSRFKLPLFSVIVIEPLEIVVSNIFRVSEVVFEIVASPLPLIFSEIAFAFVIRLMPLIVSISITSALINSLFWVILPSIFSVISPLFGVDMLFIVRFALWLFVVSTVVIVISFLSLLPLVSILFTTTLP